MKITTLLICGLAFLGIFLYIKRKAPTISQEIPDTIVVGTSADFQPFCYKDQGNIVGFDIDVIKEVAQRLGKKMMLKDMPFELLIPQLQLGTIQVIAACMTPTPERAQKVSFTQPYLAGDHLVVVTPSDTVPLKSLADLNGKRVIVNQGYTADRYMSKLEGPELVRLPTVSEAMLSLKSKRADAFVTASKAIEPYFEQQGKEKFHTFVIDDASETTALAVSSLFPKLLEKIETALQAMKEDGTLQKLKEKWHVG